MTEKKVPLHLQIFLSSPGDVADERALALKVIDQLPYDPLLRGRITIDVVAWDKPGAGTPMLATMTPQEAINQGLPKPSDCDIVVVLFWSRMGTPLPHPEYQKPDGSQYLSGTEWEYVDAIQKNRKIGKPFVVVYRRMEVPVVELTDPKRAEKIEQWERVEDFFAAFVNPDGSIKQGCNQYQKPGDFKLDFETHLKVLMKRLLEESTIVAEKPQDAITPRESPPLWEGSPFPGLRAFTPDDALIFFGRGRETDELITKVSENHFVAVVGASGSGKSSLVAAGLLPRLKKRAIEGSQDWLLPHMQGDERREWMGLRFTPGEVNENPFVSLATKLAPMVGQTPREVAEILGSNPQQLRQLCLESLTSKPDWAQVLLFIDQFEELFTLVHDETLRSQFVEMLADIAQTERVRTVVTLRADFFHQCVAYPKLAQILRAGSFPLAVPEVDALLEMITRPAARASLEFDTGLPGQIIRDTGNEPGALALLAYTLDELYQDCCKNDKGLLSQAAYDALRGVQGAIGTRAENTYAELDESAQNTLFQVFRELVEVDESGWATRQRAPLVRFAENNHAIKLLDRFIDARLLTTSFVRNEAIIEVAHEALFRHWTRLASWIELAQDDLRLRRRVFQDAYDWKNRDKPVGVS